MAASLIDTLSAPATCSKADALALSSSTLRALLVCGVALAVAIAVSSGAPEVYLRADPELARLLRGMAALKGCLVLVGAGVLWWRFGHPIGRRSAVAYVLSVWLMAAATGLVWQLTTIPLAALAFHVGAFALLGVAYFDRDATRRLRSHS